MSTSLRSPRIALFIPTYNVAATLRSVVLQIPAEVTQRLEAVYIVDNGSSDGTRAIAADLVGADKTGKTRALFNASNYSLGGSTIIAIREAHRDGMDYLICMHSDGQAAPTDLVKFIDACDSRVDFVFGNRMSSDSKVENYSKVRLWGNLFFAWLQRRVAGRPLTDLGAFIGFNIQLVSELPYWSYSSDMGYHPVLILEAFRKKRPTWKDIPIHWGEVKSTNVHPAIYGLRHLTRLVRIYFGFPPLSGKQLSDFVTHACE